MLSLVPNSNKFGVAGAPDKSIRRALSIQPAEAPQDAGSMMAMVLHGRNVEPSLDSLYHTSESARQFCDKLAYFLTPYFPAMDDKHYGSGLHEVLDMATLGYLRVAPNKEASDQIAHFLSAGINAATTVLLCYSVSQAHGKNLETWEPWEHGALGQWMRWDGSPLLFNAEIAATAEARYATRTMLMQRLLRYRDMQNIARAGIDMASLELF